MHATDVAGGAIAESSPICSTLASCRRMRNLLARGRGRRRDDLGDLEMFGRFAQAEVDATAVAEVDALAPHQARGLVDFGVVVDCA